MRKNRTIKPGTKEEIALARQQAALERKKSLEADLEYVKQDVIARQENGKYCKYSKVAKSITVTNTTISKYLLYWTNQAISKKASEEYIEELLRVIIAKFNDELTDLDKMVELERESDDKEEDKRDIIKIITTK